MKSRNVSSLSIEIPSHVRALCAGLLALLTAALLALTPASANPASGGYQLFERAASGLSADIQLVSLENFAPAPETASEYANATNTGLPAPRRVGSLQGGPLENATQVCGRFSLENGPPNGTVFRADNQGNITSYATYDANGQIVRRVDVTGAAHNGVQTPHVLEYGRNTLPDGSVRVKNPRSDPRPATPDEIP